MKGTKIEWADHTFNPWEGCTRVSPGCAHCYAETRNARFGGGTAPNWGPGAPRRRTSAANWAQPLKWDREAAEIESLPAWSAFRPDGWRRPRVFCASLADWLDDEVPIEWLADLLDLIRRTPHLDWLLLTKRPQNWRARLSVWRNAQLDSMGAPRLPRELYDWVTAWLQDTAPANVWIGTTVEDQARADERTPQGLKIPARVRFVSVEPMLGPVDVSPALGDWSQQECHDNGVPYPTGIHWVICGGESGPKARPMESEWAQSLRQQCRAAGVAFFMKQLGGAKDKRHEIAQFPAELQVREVPNG